MMKRYRIVLASAAIMVVGCGETDYATGITAAAGPRTSIAAHQTTATDLGTLGGAFSIAFGMNDLGQVVGRSSLASGEQRPFIWQLSTGMRDLGTLGGACTTRGCAGHAINNFGQVVGMSQLPNGLTTAFFWEDGVITDLGFLPGTINTAAWDINDLGQVVGTSGSRAFLWSRTTGMVDIASGSFAAAFGISNEGTVVGEVAAPGGRDVFTWTAADGLTTLGLNGLGGFLRPLGINRRNDFAGIFSRNDGARHAFAFTQSGGFIDLHEAGGFSATAPGFTTADGPNERGQVPIFGNRDGAWYWTESEGFIQLTDVFGGARASNNYGMFAGLAGARAFLWTTISPSEQLGLIADDIDVFVNEGTLTGGQGNSLKRKLDNAATKIDRGSTQAGINQLRAFINQLTAWVSNGTLTAAEAQPLMNAAQSVIDQLSA